MVHSVAFPFLSASFVAAFSSLPVDALDNKIRSDLQDLSHSFFVCVLWSAFVVAVGCILEGPEIAHDIFPNLTSFFTWQSEDKLHRFEVRVKKIAAVGWLLICVGLLGEGAFEALQNRAEGQLQTFNDILLIDAKDRAATAQLEAGDAAISAANAHKESEAAKTASGDAQTIARGARKEADSFENDIKLAKKQAEDTANQLAPRTLNPVDWEAIGDEWKPFSLRFAGRKVKVSSYSQDAEGIAFSVEITKIFERSNIDVDPVIGRMIPVGLVDMGVNISGPIMDKGFMVLLAEGIRDRAKTNVRVEWNDKYKEVSVEVDSKPIAGLPTILPSKPDAKTNP